MKKAILLITFLCCSLNLNAQISCPELIDYVKTESYGSTYYSYGSDAIRQVSFHEVSDDSYNTYYFAIVQFTSSYKEYIYQVSSSTKFNYSLEYLDSAGKAFWRYIQPYNQNLECAPDFD